MAAGEARVLVGVCLGGTRLLMLPPQTLFAVAVQSQPSLPRHAPPLDATMAVNRTYQVTPPL